MEGVKIKNLRVIPDERGRLTEILRRDEDLFKGFGQVYVTTAYPGVVKAWHCHQLQTDNLAVISGMAKVVLYDQRPESQTRGEILEVFMGEHRPLLVQVPPGIWHGFKAIGPGEVLVMNCPDRPYNHQQPDELRMDPHAGTIPYKWDRQDG